MHPTHTSSLTVPAAAQSAHVGSNGFDAGHAINGHNPARVTQSQRSAQVASSRVEELLLADRRKDEFLAMLSHELRSPLASILNALGVLRTANGEEVLVQRKMYELIERQVRHMALLSTALMDISGINCGHLRLSRERIDLRVVLGHAIETLESELKERHQQLTATWPDSPMWLHADAARLEQVFVNLIANASKYSYPGRDIVVQMQALGGHAVIGVRDSGIGIAPESLPHVFELFMQADSTAPRSRSGLGIGLALVRSLVELHGGSVTAVSAGIGQGSEFTVRLPQNMTDISR